MVVSKGLWQQQELIFSSDKSEVLLRPILPEDKVEIVRAFAQLSPQSRYHRFLGPLMELSPSFLSYLTEINYVDHFALGAFCISLEEPALIGVARYVRLTDEPQSADVAVAVIDNYQHRGIGKQLLCALVSVAFENGIRRFVGNALQENQPIRGLLQQVKAQTMFEGSGVLRFEVDLAEILG